MTESQAAWTDVWKRSFVAGEYSFALGRFERALDKLNHFKSIGVEFNSGEKVLEAGCGDGAVVISLQKSYGVCGYGAAVIMTPNSLSAGRFDRILKQALGVWRMGFQDEFCPKKLAGFLSDAGFVGIRPFAVHRPNLPHDTWSRKLVSYVDKGLRLLVCDWGFYSYVWARKG